jgi:hypothetical protein
MKKLMHIIFLMLVISTVTTGCGTINKSDQNNSNNPNNSDNQNNSNSSDLDQDDLEVVFEAIVIEVNESLLVEPVEGSNELNSSDRIVVGLKDVKITDQTGTEIALDELAIGNILEITYDGMIAESYPAQIRASKIIFLDKQDEKVTAEPTDVFDEEVNNFDGVTMKLTKATNTSISVELLNTTDHNVNFGSDYDLQQLIDGRWYSLSYLIENWGFTSEAYIMTKDEPFTWEEDWETFHGSLSKGYYRYLKTIMDFRDTGDYTNYYLATEFEIKE